MAILGIVKSLVGLQEPPEIDKRSRAVFAFSKEEVDAKLVKFWSKFSSGYFASRYGCCLNESRRNICDSDSSRLSSRQINLNCLRG